MADRNNDGLDETCEAFRMCSPITNIDGGNCLQMTTNFLCVGCDPVTEVCEELSILFKHARADRYFYEDL